MREAIIRLNNKKDDAELCIKQNEKITFKMLFLIITYLLFNCDYSGHLELDIRNLDLPISENKFKASLKKLYDEGLIYGDTQGNHREIYISDYQEKYVE